MASSEGVLKTTLGVSIRGDWLDWLMRRWQDEVSKSQPSTFWVQPIWGLCAGGQHAVNFYLVGVLISPKQFKDMTQDIIYSPWGGTKGPWLCFMDKLLRFCLAFFCFCIFSLLWLKWLFGTQGRPRGLKLFYRQEAVDSGVWFREGPLGSCFISLRAVKFRDRKLSGGLQELGEGKQGHCLMGTDRVSVWGGEKVLEMDGGDDCTAMWKY